MTNLIPFEGSHERNGSKIFIPSGELLLTPRKSTKQSKSKTGIYLLHIDQNGKRKYVSSLWEKTPDTYEFEYARIRYRLTLTPTTADVVNIADEGANRNVYHKRLVPQFGTAK